ncbi:MAG: hypothetical protein CMQ16_11315 [Gammaproteobacteria bacterium]|nr:hypothetical protein [Gammaproteobacteria bacterium]
MSAVKLTQINVQASGIPNAMTGILADLIGGEVAGGSAMLSLGAAHRLGSRYWLTAGRLSVGKLLVWLSAEQPAP